MDKEQAIEKLNDIRCHVKETSAEEQALVMAIDALKQPVATDICVGDTISRQAVIDEIKSVYEWHDTVTMERLIEHLNNLPPIQPERKKGEWSDGYRWQRCSLCKQTGKKSWNYCPNCGADMRGEKDERTD